MIASAGSIIVSYWLQKLTTVIYVLKRYSQPQLLIALKKPVGGRLGTNGRQ
jgi:hypothetical protein